MPPSAVALRSRPLQIPRRSPSKFVSLSSFHAPDPPSLSQQGPSSWKMLYGMDVNLEKGLALVVDNFGFLHLVDARTNHKTSDAILIHKKGTRVFGLHCNAVHPDLLLSYGDLLLSYGNDHFVSSLPFSFSYYY